MQDEDTTYAANQLDRSVVNPDQIRTVFRAFRDKLPEILPGRREVPKTLVFAKTDSHADDIIQTVREEFGQGNEFCKKITYRVEEDPRSVLAQFRNDYYPRIAVTVDMIATGTDVKPLECLLFMRDVRSRNYFEQMKGRGTRTLGHDDLRKVTPSALTAKTHYVIVDAVGVTKSLKTASRPLTRSKLRHKMKYLRVANVYADQILTDNVHEIGVTEAEARKVALKVGDLLVVEGNGSMDQIGRVAMWNGELSVCGHQNHLIRVRLADGLEPRFVLQFLLSPQGRDSIVKEASSTSGLHTLSISKVSNLVVPVTSPAEEAAVVTAIDEKLEGIDRAVEEVDRQFAKSEALRQSILKKAFSGELVAQDPKEEPASVLLDRIRAEKRHSGKRDRTRPHMQHMHEAKATS